MAGPQIELRRTENGRVYQWSFAARRGDVVKGLIALYPLGAPPPTRTEEEEVSLVHARLKVLAGEFHKAAMSG